MRLIGYARVSTDDQTTRMQLDALRAAGCEVIHEDSASGSSRSRPGLARAFDDLRRGDTLCVWKLDRLGRSLPHLLEVSQALLEAGVALRSLTEHIDTSTPAGRMLYSVLGAVAEFERDTIRERSRCGLIAARSRGERIGRKPALTPAQVLEVRAMRERGDGAAHIARVLRVSAATVYRVFAV
jgi:DNA invertase Pin-like site-specific DNA recombinase